MKIEVGQVWSFNNQAELDWLIVKIEGLGVEYKRSKEYEFYRDYNDMNRRKENTCLLIRENRTDFCYREYFEDKGYTILEVADYMEGNRMFKVGDRVKVVGNTYDAPNRVKEGVVAAIDNKGDVYILEDKKNRKFVYHKLDLKLIKKTPWKVVEREPKLGSRNDTLIVEQNTETKELRLTTGCFTGTLDEFEAAAKRKPFGNKHRYDYEFYIKRYKVKYPDYKKEVRYIIKLNDKCYFAGSAKIAERKIDALKFEFESNAQKFRKRFGGTIEEITLNK